MEGKPKQRNYTRELKNAAVRGAVVECAMAPYEGWTVLYVPRSVNDPQPWTLYAPNGDCRYSGRECRVRREENA